MRDKHLDGRRGSLLSMVLETHQDNYAQPLREQFIHGQTYSNDEEWDAFSQAAPKETMSWACASYDRRRDQVFRDDDYPVLRGTGSILDEKTTICGPMAMCRSSTPISARDTKPASHHPLGHQEYAQN